MIIRLSGSMRSGKFALLLSVLIHALVYGADVWAQVYPNQPTGSTVLLDEPWSAFNPNTTNQTNGWINNYPGCDAFIVTDLSAPVSPPNVLRAHRAAGSLNGSCSMYKVFPQVTKVYGSDRFRVSNPFYGVQAGSHKILGYISQAASGGHFTRWDIAGPSGGPWTVRFAFNGPADNCHYRGQPWFINPIASECNLVYAIAGNIANTTVFPGQWVHLEWIFELGTCSTCKNGRLTWWVNGILNGHLTDINHVEAPWYIWSYTNTWDGQPQQNASVESWIDHDQFRIATFNQSGPTEPIDNPPGPPGTVTGVTVTVQ